MDLAIICFEVCIDAVMLRNMTVDYDTGVLLCGGWSSSILDNFGHLGW